MSLFIELGLRPPFCYSFSICSICSSLMFFHFAFFFTPSFGLIEKFWYFFSPTALLANSPCLCSQQDGSKYAQLDTAASPHTLPSASRLSRKPRWGLSDLHVCPSCWPPHVLHYLAWTPPYSRAFHCVSASGLALNKAALLWPVRHRRCV